MQSALKQMDPDSLRFQVLSCARNFKSNWMDLGSLLHKINQSTDFKKWGYYHFEDYCKRELKIKLETAMKLVASYGYVKTHKPELTQKQSLSPVPDYKVINNLMEAEEHPGLNERNHRDLRSMVFDSGLSRAGLKKHILEMAGEDEPKSREEQMLEKLQRAVLIAKKILPEFAPPREIIRAIDTLDAFVEEIEL